MDSAAKQGEAMCQEMVKDWKDSEEAGYWETGSDDYMVEDWKASEDPGYWETGSHQPSLQVPHNMFNDWVVSEETGYDVRLKPIDDYTAELVDQLPLSASEKGLFRSHVSLVSTVYILCSYRFLPNT